MFWCKEKLNPDIVCPGVKLGGSFLLVATVEEALGEPVVFRIGAASWTLTIVVECTTADSATVFGATPLADFGSAVLTAGVENGHLHFLLVKERFEKSLL